MQGVNIANMFIAAAQRWRGVVAMETPDSSLTHDQLLQLVMQMARHLRAHGVDAGDHVGVALVGGPASITTMIALWVLGAVVVPLDFRSRTHERQRQVKSLNMKFVVEGRRAEDGDGYTGIALDDDWVDALAGYSHDLILPQPGSHPAILSLTSGTSGTPRVMRMDHQSWYCRHSLLLLQGHYRPGVRYFNPTPISFSASRTRSLTRLLTGGTVIFSPPLFSAEELAEGINASGANHSSVVPTVLRDLLELAEKRDAPLFPKLEVLHCGGASISVEEKLLAIERLSPNFVVGYGSTGTGMIAMQYGKDFDRHPASVGRPFPIVLVQVVDEHDNVLQPGEVGSIRVRSPGNALEIYEQEPGNNDGKGDRIAEGWVYPGDLGSLSEDGYLTLRGRSANVIIRGGANVYPAELEAVLNEHPAIRESAVVGYPSRTHGEEIAAFVVADDSVTRQDLMAFCLSRFSPDKRPRELFIVDRLPQSSAGKVLHRELVDRLKSDDTV